jgi:DNA-binding transcriptional LysR family regulator
MNINQLKALQLVVKTGSVSETARAMNLSQPAISKMIRTLEGELGVPLLNHAKGKVEPRVELSMLLPTVERIGQEISDLESITKELRAGSTGSLLISCSNTVGMSLVMPAYRALLGRRPDIRAGLITRGGRFSLRDVQSNRAHLAVEQPVQRPTGLVTRFVARGYMKCVLPEGHRLLAQAEVRIEDLDRERLVLYPPKTFNGARVHRLLEEKQISYDAVVLTDSGVLACQMASDCNVAAIVDSCMDVEHLFPQLTTRPLVPALEFELHAIWKERNMRPPLKWVISELVERGKELERAHAAG